MQNIGIIRHNTLRAEYNTTCSRNVYKITFEYLGRSHDKNVRCNISVNATVQQPINHVIIIDYRCIIN